MIYSNETKIENNGILSANMNYWAAPSVLSKTKHDRHTVNSLEQAVVNYFEIPIEIIKSNSRKRFVCHVRQVLCYMFKYFTSMSLHQISDRLFPAYKPHDHTSCRNAYLVIVDELKYPRQFDTNKEVSDIEKMSLDISRKELLLLLNE